MKTAKLRHVNQDGGPNGSWLNRPFLISNDKKWSFWDIRDWSVEELNMQDIVQAIVDGALSLEDYETLEKILKLGGLVLREGPKEPIP